uniref:Uncharacterized protein n=1 Tax=Arundo donax TaxID=35708 RepID=A0A0A9ABC7_ARUDO
MHFRGNNPFLRSRNKSDWNAHQKSPSVVENLKSI